MKPKLINHTESTGLSIPGRYLMLQSLMLPLALFLTLLLTLWPTTSMAGELVFLDNNTQFSPLGLKVHILKDPQAQWTLQDIQSPDIAAQFKPSTQKVPNYGFSHAAYWVRVTLNSQAINNKQWLLEVGYPVLDEVEVFLIQNNGQQTDYTPPYKQWKTGDALPFADRPVEHANFIFPFTMAPKQTITLILRVRTTGAVQIPLTLWSPQKFIEHNTKNTLGLGIYFGIMLVMMLYNGFIYLSVRDRSYLYYVAYLFFISFFLLSLNGLSYQYLWPTSPWWANHGIYIFIGAFNLLALLFSQHFLHIKEHSPRFDRLFTLLQIIASLLIISAIFLYPTTIYIYFVISNFAAITLVLSAGTHCMMRGYRPARFFLLAWVGLLGASVLRILLSLALIPNHFLVEYSVQIGSALEVILLSLALADRINELQRQAREHAQTAQKNAELATKNAEKANHAKSIFIANVSHEIRTPLNAVLGYTQMLNRSSTLAQQHKSQVDIIEKSGLHLLGLINDILDISKIEAHAMALLPQDFELVALVQGIGVMFDARSEEKRLKWQLDNRAPQHIEVHGDQGKLRQILINLLGNAVKFTPQGSITLHLSCGSPDHYLFEVIDTGVGIDEAHQKEIFKAFGQTVEGSRHGGTGLGLAIASKQVALMGGQLQLESTPGKGSRFYFTIPLPAAQQIIEPRHNRHIHAISLAPGVLVRAMVVDDIKENRDILKQMLQDVGIEVSEAANGLEAMNLLHNCKTLPELIFIDIRMPVMDGVTALANIQRDFKDRCPICIVVTAHVMQQDVEHYLHQGFDHYIAKPFRFEAIYECIHHLLDVEFEYRDEPTIQTPDNLPEQDFSTLIIPQALCKSLCKAAADHEISKLEEDLKELATLSVQSSQYADYLQAYIARYDIDGLMASLNSIKCSPNL